MTLDDLLETMNMADGLHKVDIVYADVTGYILTGLFKGDSDDALEKLVDYHDCEVYLIKACVNDDNEPYFYIDLKD